MAADGWRLPGVEDAAGHRAAESRTRPRTRRPSRAAEGGRPRLVGARPVGHPSRRCRPASSSRAASPTGDFRPRSATSRSVSTRTSTRCWRRARRVTGGSNVIGLQDPALDDLLVAARGPGHARRSARPPIRPSRSSSRRAATCSRWPSPTSRSWSATRSSGPTVRQVADPADRFWDVLTWRLAAGR